MSQPTTAPARPAATERAIAWTTIAAPIGVGITAPLLDGSAAILGAITYGGTAGFLAANYMNRLPDNLLHQLPAGDIIRGHRTTLFTSTLTSGMALLMGTAQGPAGTDALMAGFLDLAGNPIPGIVSLGWWAAVAVVPLKLRKILARQRKTTPHITAPPGTPAAVTVDTPAKQIVHRWYQIISNHETGTHKGQELELRTLSALRWNGIITARPGQAVTVTDDTVSSAYQATPYQAHASWITIKPGAHSGEATITVNLQPPAELDPNTLAGAWRKWVGRKGGVMADTHLEDVQTDPNTGGEVAYVIAGETINKIPVPDRAELAGALRTNTLLCSYNPVPGDPRKGEIRLMKHNPLQEGVPFPGTDVLKISDGGYVQVGRHVSGFPARIQFTDPHLGARHLFIAGVTGSGKGGLVQIVALADHVNGHAIINGDPKGSSNPDVETMACYNGLGEDGVMGALRVAYALLQWRIKESARLKMKNFVATPDRPWVRVILDEAHVPLSELVDHKKEAGIILEALAAKARSLGIILTIVNQAVNADKLGGSTALRMNVIQGGSLVMLRSDSGQQHLVTTGFEGVDPGQIPASWDVERPLVYDETVTLKDPKSTFGLGYTLGPGGAAEMMRTFILESAAPYIDETAIAYPADWPDWDDRDEIAATPILGDEDGTDSDPSDGTASLLSGIDLGPKKPPTAEEKILEALQSFTDPAGIETIYTSRDTISRVSGVSGSTLDNTLSAMTRKELIHRGADCGRERGTYALGRLPITDET
ncbi:Cell division FtsK/SpoIIIE (plasmid) [Streptomyces ambofaciens ATCC 23877]|uniref:Cell division FtsK/SpoIIIE n=1 Tax=Streptomyces ambofaciens (strain ATCC 23877 / 3486 / DSM 40053 / JCM 4204 / NBRC 12836 / NRRL B-2516) TaxID=278992 RepID=A0A0K2B6M4_STRA7|nr:type IV secretory system conjugative DNA transfer family protein [Streptomyces ambofaciens]AKZ60712.1 Cell division FtsK/SpoIIIE [Streptomyces ambofaciens ATCC 23877]